MKGIRKLVFIISLAVFLFCGWKIGAYFYEGHVAEQQFVEIKKEIVEEKLTLEDLKEQNDDLWGWVTIKDTNIDYPVMYTPEDPEFYLRKNFDKEYAAEGVPFVDGIVDMDDSQVMFIYGHMMKNGYMFNNLTKYDDEGFFEEHKTIELEVLGEGKKTYQVFAFGKTETTTKGFDLYDYRNVYGEDQFNEFVSGVKGLTIYDTWVEPQYGEKIIVLSTCSYHHEDGRYFVAAVEK